jgi:hypothetical protein
MELHVALREIQRIYSRASPTDEQRVALNALIRTRAQMLS